MFTSTDNVFSYYKAIIVSGLGPKNPQSFKYKIFRTITGKKYGENCLNSEKAVTTNEILTEYTINICSAIGSTDYRLKDLKLRILENAFSDYFNFCLTNLFKISCRKLMKKS